MKLVQKSLMPLFLALTALFASFLPLAAAPKDEPPPYLEYFDLTKGFKPGQRSFGKIFMQIAGSLEHYGTPEPYIRYVMDLHRRTGRKACPDYLTDEYVEKLINNWNRQKDGLKLEALARDAGRNMRLALMGTRNMPAWEAVAQETALSPKEAVIFRKFLEKPYFKKSDFKDMEVFYADGGVYDKLSPIGKSAISLRFKRGQMAPDQRDASIRDKGGTLAVEILNDFQDKLMAYFKEESKEVITADNLIDMLKEGLKLNQEMPDLSGMDEYTYDAIGYSHLTRADFTKRFDYIRQAAKNKDNGEAIIKSLTLMVENIAILAKSEFAVNVSRPDEQTDTKTNTQR